MGKDDYLNLALHGETPEERHIGNIVTSLLNMSARTGDDLKTFEIHVGTASKDELLRLRQQRLETLQPYWEAAAAWEKEHPRPEEGSFIEWYRQQTEALKPEWGDRLDKIDAIHKSFTADRQGVFDDLACSFRDMMVQLRSTTLIELGFRNYDTARKIVDKQPHEGLDARLSEHLTKMNDLTREYTQNPTSDTTRQALEGLSTSFVELKSVLRDVYGTDPKFDHDMFNGRMGPSYFFGPDDFFRHFNWHSTPNDPEGNIFFGQKGERMSFYLGGMLEGEYLLTANSNLDFKEAPQGDYSTMALISPVHFRVQLSERYDQIVQPVFDQVAKDYEGKIISPDDLQNWRSDDDRS